MGKGFGIGALEDMGEEDEDVYDQGYFSTQLNMCIHQFNLEFWKWHCLGFKRDDWGVSLQNLHQSLLPVNWVSAIYAYHFSKFLSFLCTKELNVIKVSWIFLCKTQQLKNITVFLTQINHKPKRKFRNFQCIGFNDSRLKSLLWIIEWESRFCKVHMSGDRKFLWKFYSVYLSQ